MKAPYRGTSDDPAPSGARRTQLNLTERDREAMELIRQRRMYSHSIEALRWALSEQSRRDRGVSRRGEPHLSRSAALAIREAVRLPHGREAEAEDYLPVVAQWHCWLRPDDLERLEAVAAAWCLCNHSEAARFALRIEVRCTEEQDGGGG